MAMELGARRVTVNGLTPGWPRSDTNTAVRHNADVIKSIEGDTVHVRYGEALDVAVAVALLASDETSWVTAQNIEASDSYRL